MNERQNYSPGERAADHAAWEGFGLKHQLAERPWMVLGAAVAAGYVLGSRGGQEQRWHGQPLTTTHYYPHAAPENRASTSAPKRSNSLRSDAILSEFDAEMALIKTAAVATLKNYARALVSEYVPSLGQRIGQPTEQAGARSTAPGASRYVNPSSPTTNYEAIPTTTSYGSNLVDKGSEHATPYYPPGSTGTDGDR